MAKTLKELTADYRKATEDLATARDALTAGVRQAAADGMKQMEIVRELDHEWTREYVAKLIKNPA